MRRKSIMRKITYRLSRIDTWVAMFFIFVTVILTIGVVRMIVEELQPPEQIDLTFMLKPYLGLPFAFWLFVSFGIMFGLTFHGFKLLYIEGWSKARTTNCKQYSEQGNLVTSEVKNG